MKSRAEPEERAADDNWTSTLASVLGGIFGGGQAEEKTSAAKSTIDYRDMWERFQSASEAEIPSDDNELMDVLVAALGLARDEWSGSISPVLIPRVLESASPAR